MNLYSWAARWNIPIQAIAELQKLFGLAFDTTGNTDLSETAVLNQIRLEASRKNITLWRNNVGAMHTQDGRFVRFGLANESGAMNKKIKSSDLVGIKPVVITVNMLGKTIGQFIARETKAANWTYKGTDREQAQLNWIQFVNSKGGDACFCTKAGTL